jgi:hypothetical protein
MDLPCDMNEYHASSFCAKIIGCHLKRFPASPYSQFMTYEQYIIHSLLRFEMPSFSSLLSRWEWKLNEHFRTGSVLCYIVEKNFRNWFVFRLYASYRFLYQVTPGSHFPQYMCPSCWWHEIRELGLGVTLLCSRTKFHECFSWFKKMKLMTHTQTARQTRIYFCL